MKKALTSEDVVDCVFFAEPFLSKSSSGRKMRLTWLVSIPTMDDAPALLVLLGIEPFGKEFLGKSVQWNTKGF